MKREREDLPFLPASLGARGVGTFRTSLVWPSMQGGTLYPGMQTVVSESILVTHNAVGAGDVRLLTEYTLTDAYEKVFSIVTGTFTIGIAKAKTIASFPKLANITPSTAVYSPLVISERTVVDMDNTVDQQSNVVNGYYRAGIPQKLSSPVVESVQSTTVLNKDYVYGPARQRVINLLSGDAGMPSQMRTIDLSTLTSAILPLFVVSQQFHLAILYGGTGAFQTVTSVGVEHENCPSLSEIPYVPTLSAALAATHFCFKLTSAGTEIVAVRNRIPSEGVAPDGERSLVWFGTLIYATGLSDLASSVPKAPYFSFRVPPNQRLVVLSQLVGNTIYATGTGKAIIAPGQIESAYSNQPEAVEEAERTVARSNANASGNEERVRFEV